MAVSSLNSEQKCPGIASLRALCQYPVVQKKLAEGPEVNFSDLPFPLNQEASEIIEKFYAKFRKEDGSIDRLKVIDAMAWDFNSLLDPKIYHFAMKELLKIDPEVLLEIGSFENREKIKCILMSMYNNDRFHNRLRNNFIVGDSNPLMRRYLSGEFARMFTVMQGIKKSTIDLSTYNFQGPLDHISSMVFFMEREQIRTLLRRQDLNQRMLNSIYEGVLFKENNLQLFMELIRDEQIGNPSRLGMRTIFANLTSLGNVRAIRYLVDNLPINLRPSQEMINNLFLQACAGGRINVVRYLLEEAPVAARRGLDHGIRQATSSGKLEVILYLLAGTFDGIRTSVSINDLIVCAAHCDKVNVVKYFLEERSQEITEVQSLIIRIFRPLRFMLAGRPGNTGMNVLKYLLKDAPMKFRLNKATIALICNVARNHEMTKYLWSQFTLQEKILLQTCKIFKGFRHLANKLF